MNFRRAFMILSLCVLTAGARAVEMRPMPIAELTQKSDLVLQGTVLSQTCQRDDAGRIYTRIQLKVDDVWKGNLTTNVFTIVHGGGTVGDERLEVSGQVEFEVGEEVVAFLVLNQRGEGVCLGLSQGKFHVWNDPATGGKCARNPFHGRSSDGIGIPAAAQPGAAAVASGPLTVADLKRSVQGGVR